MLDRSRPRRMPPATAGIGGAMTLVRRLAAVPIALAVLAAVPAGSSAAEREISVFARIPESPGLPEGIATGPDGDVFVGTNPGGNTPGQTSGVPSKIYRYTAGGSFVRDYTIQGQETARALLPAYGLQQLAFDGDGMLYALDKAPPRVLKIDPATGRQSTYATFADVKPCAVTGGAQPCSKTVEDAPPFPNYPAFAPDGSMIVSDFQQGLLWRVPKGGGPAKVILTDERLDNPLGGPNGLQFRADGKTLVFTQSLTLPVGNPPSAASTRLFQTTIGSDGSATPARQFYESNPGDGGDGLVLGRSGDTYLNSFTSSAILRIAPNGQQVERIQTRPGVDLIPFDSPASSVFQGNDILVTNQSVFFRTSTNYAVLRVPVGEPGLPLFRPSMTGAPAPTGSAATTTTRRTPRLKLRSVRASRSGSVRRVAVRGTLVRPTGVSRAAGCRGTVTLRLTRSGARTTTRRARVTSSCRFSVRLSVPARRLGTFRVSARYGGTSVLKPRSATRRIRVR